MPVPPVTTGVLLEAGAEENADVVTTPDDILDADMVVVRLVDVAGTEIDMPDVSCEDVGVASLKTTLELGEIEPDADEAVEPVEVASCVRTSGKRHSRVYSDRETMFHAR